MKLLFENSRGEKRELFSGNKQDCFKYIKNFLDEHNFKSYYYQITKLENGERIDVGSHTEFFYILEE